MSKFYLIDTGRVHRDKKGNALCRIYQAILRPTRYTCEKLREIRAKQTREALENERLTTVHVKYDNNLTSTQG